MCQSGAANIRTWVYAYQTYRERTNEMMFNMVMARYHQQHLNRRLDELYNTLEAQRVGWGYRRIHPRHEFIVVLGNNIPVIQRTQTLNARRKLNFEDDDDDRDFNLATNTIPKGPRDKRNAENCTFIVTLTLTSLYDLTNPDLEPGIYVFGNRDILLNDKLDHVTNVFNMIKKTLHAWHDSWFYTVLHEKMNLAFKEFTKQSKM